jgi:hypothetical protein
MKTTSMSRGQRPRITSEAALAQSGVISGLPEHPERIPTLRRRAGGGQSVSQTTIRQWLKDRTLAWPFHIVTDRARLVDRFLDWRVNNRALANNPFADLRAEYGQRTTTPVVRALLNPTLKRHSKHYARFPASAVFSAL